MGSKSLEYICIWCVCVYSLYFTCMYTYAMYIYVYISLEYMYMCPYILHTHIQIHMHIFMLHKFMLHMYIPMYRGLSVKSPAIVNKTRTVWVTSMALGSQEEWTGMCMCEQWLHRNSHWRWQTLLREHLYCVVVAFKMTEQAEQWICIKFCIKLEHSFGETIWMIQKAFGDNATSAAQIKVWHKCFRDDREGLRKAGHLRKLNMYALQSTKISNWQCKN